MFRSHRCTARMPLAHLTKSFNVRKEGIWKEGKQWYVEWVLRKGTPTNWPGVFRFSSMLWYQEKFEPGSLPTRCANRNSKFLYFVKLWNRVQSERKGRLSLQVLPAQPFSMLLPFFWLGLSIWTTGYLTNKRSTHFHELYDSVGFWNQNSYRGSHLFPRNYSLSGLEWWPR